MRKAIIVCVVLLGISLFATIVSAVVCGGELLKWGIECGIEHYEEYCCCVLQAIVTMSRI